MNITRILKIYTYVALIGLSTTSVTYGSPSSKNSSHLLVKPSASPDKQTGSNSPQPFMVMWNGEGNPLGSKKVLVVSEEELDDVFVEMNGVKAIEVPFISASGPPYAKLFSLQANEQANEITEQNSGQKTLCAMGQLNTRLVCINGFDTAQLGQEPTVQTGVWATTRNWNENWDRVFSVWITHLFRPIPTEVNKGWHRLHDVLRNPVRNFLHNKFGLEEDNPTSRWSIKAVADCGDLPYQLRAYFAWKFGLPFRFSECSRGTGTDGPTCDGEIDNRTSKYDRIENNIERFNHFLEVLSWKVHSGTFRSLPSDEQSDFYPLSLDRKSIRPGTVFVDSGGHILMVAQWDANGLYAVDAHPDKTVTRRQFKPRFFPYYLRLQTGGFKAFRPFHFSQEKFSPVSNNALAPFYSRVQYSFENSDDFYTEMNRQITKHRDTN